MDKTKLQDMLEARADAALMVKLRKARVAYMEAVGITLRDLTGILPEKQVDGSTYDASGTIIPMGQRTLSVQMMFEILESTLFAQQCPAARAVAVADFMAKVEAVQEMIQ